MSWQDVILTFGGVVGAIALLPSIFTKHKPALATSLLSALVASSTVAVDISFSLYYATTVWIVVCALWLILAVQQWEQTH